jgi:hypothetical protein
MRRRGVLFSLLLPLLGACDESPSSPSGGPVNQTFTLAPGQTTIVTDTTLRVRFEGVSQDSRCPGDALCVRQGDATAVFSVSDPQDPVRVELKTDGPVVAVGPYKLQVQALMPYPFSSLGPINPSDYRVTIQVTN